MERRVAHWCGKKKKNEDDLILLDDVKVMQFLALAFSVLHFCMINVSGVAFQRGHILIYFQYFQYFVLIVKIKKKCTYLL